MAESGIYSIENTETGMIYLGQAMDIHKRWQSHVNNLKRNRHANAHLQAAWNENGAGAFKFSVLENCTTEILTEREQHYLDAYIPLGFCYNVRRNAHTPGSSLFRQLRKQTAANSDRHGEALDAIEALLIKLYRNGDKFRIMCLLMAVSETDEQIAELTEEADARFGSGN